MKCNICKSEDISLVNNKVLYGRPYGKTPYIYLCNKCGSYVGVHPDMKPMGIFADNQMRKLRKMCHKLFDCRWTNKSERSKAYEDLAAKMNLAVEDCHFSMFDKQTLIRAIEIMSADNND